MNIPLLAVIIFVLAVAIYLVLVLRKKINAGIEEDEIIQSHRVEQAALLSIADAVITTDKSGHVVYMNTTAERLTEWDNNAARGHAIQSIFNATDLDSPSLVLDPVGQCLKDGQVVRLVKPVNLRGRMVSRSVVEATVSPTRNRSGELIGAILVFHDISKVRELQDHINYQASHDPLTGLLHRQEFEKYLEASLKSAHASGRNHAMCYMDVNHFRVINENFGHVAGDELLIQLSVLLRSMVRDEDTLARLGGDEFAILLNNCPVEEAENKVRAIIELIEKSSFSWKGSAVDYNLAFGVVAINPASGSTNEIIKSAESACFTAKGIGRNQLVVYKSSDPEQIKHRGEMRWVKRIREALKNQEFQLYYQRIQPIQDDNQEALHYELLMRTEDRNHDLVSPEDFIPAAERYNLMIDIDRWVVSAAIKNISRLQGASQGEASGIYGVNLSGQSLGDSAFVEYVEDLFQEHKVNPGMICFEITETSAILDQKIALTIINKLKRSGCRFALDDFGTGVSSYLYLKTYPFDYVKIDGSFIRNIENSPVDAVMVESICRVASVMGIKTIAEFVEQEELIEKLKNIGVDFVQGYAIAKPAPLTEWMNKPASPGDDAGIGKLLNKSDERA
ncbi:EAL domain-containing protein [Kaarinaea lacus]